MCEPYIHDGDYNTVEVGWGGDVGTSFFRSKSTYPTWSALVILTYIYYSKQGKLKLALVKP